MTHVQPPLLCILIVSAKLSDAIIQYNDQVQQRIVCWLDYPTDCFRRSTSLFKHVLLKPGVHLIAQLINPTRRDFAKV